MDINFRYTPQIQRYNSEMSRYWNECRKNMPDHEIPTFDPLVITTTIQGEPLDDDIDVNRMAYLEWLERQHGIRYLTEEDGMTSGFQVPPDGEYETYPSDFTIHVLDLKPVISLENSFHNGANPFTKTDPYAGNRYIRMKNDGSFEYGYSGREKPIKFKRYKSLYYRVFRALYELAPHNKECVPYDAIEAQIVRLGEASEPNGEKRRQRIREAISKSLEPNAKKLDLPLKIDGVQTIKLVDGEGYQFYNPTIEDY